MRKVIDINRSRTLNVVFLSPTVSYAAVIDSEDNEVEITEQMIDRACASAEGEQVYPFARTASR